MYSGAQFNALCLKNVRHLAFYNFDVHEPISIIFWQKIAEKVSNQMTLYFPTSRN